MKLLTIIVLFGLKGTILSNLILDLNIYNQLVFVSKFCGIHNQKPLTNHSKYWQYLATHPRTLETTLTNSACYEIVFCLCLKPNCAASRILLVKKMIPFGC